MKIAFSLQSAATANSRRVANKIKVRFIVIENSMHFILENTLSHSNLKSIDWYSVIMNLNQPTSSRS